MTSWPTCSPIRTPRPMARTRSRRPPETPTTLPGDLWLLGGHKGRPAHRVLRRDSTARDATLRLLARQKPPFIMATDPPYGVGLTPEWREQVGLNPSTRQGGKVSNDDRVDWSAARSEERRVGEECRS